MSTQPRRRIDRDTAEQLLARSPAGTQAHPEIAILLSAAAGPPRREELDGEQAALAAFRSARLGHVTRQRRRSMISNMLAKVFTVKVGAIALATSAVGGVALASSTTELSTAPGSTVSAQPVERDAGSSGRPGKDGDTVGDERGRAKNAKDGKDGKEARAGKDAKAQPSPSLVGLCRAYRAGVADSKGKALENPAFGALIKAAGGKDKVTAFCVTVEDKSRLQPTPSASPENGKADPRKARGRAHEKLAKPSHSSQ